VALDFLQCVPYLEISRDDHVTDLMTSRGLSDRSFRLVCFFFMPDTPAAASFLPDEEKEWVLRRMRIDAGGSTQVDVDDEEFSWYWVKMALKAPQTYLSAFIWFFLLVPLYVSRASRFSFSVSLWE
jgi:hypothetical protein